MVKGKNGTTSLYEIVNGFLSNEKWLGLHVAMFNFAKYPAKLPKIANLGSMGDW